MSLDARPADTRSPLKRIAANTAWLLGGKGFGAVCGIIYLAILTRSLGVKDFGHFSLIFGTAQALIALAGFETWRVVVRYGSDHIHQGEWDRFGRLAMACGLLDAAGAMIGSVVAFLVIFGFADSLDLNPAYIGPAFWFSCAMLWALVSAPTGVLRALHRFDRAVYVEAIVPLGRLVAALLIWWTGPSVIRYLIAWALIDLIEAGFYWVTARRLCPQAINVRNLRLWRLALTENRGLVRFALVTHAGGTIDAIMRHGPLLAVGGLVSTKAAGLYRLASQLTQAMGKLSSLLTRSVYAEVAHVKASSGPENLRRLALQTSAIAALAGGLTTALAWAFGEELLGLIGGAAFEQGASILIPLAVAGSFELASVVFEPVLHSTNAAGRALMARISGVIAMTLGIFLVFAQNAEGIAWSVALGSATTYCTLALLALQRVSRPH
ncbi:MAG: lipopolysaccharide biosynthesis protein [Novosphingobium sp.]|nr:lipopolysaccharide biosynthesis protein [Novosphingobium sp.]